jgi:hypothetical protein
LEAQQIRLIRPICGHASRDNQRNETIGKELDVANTVEDIDKYGKQWRGWRIIQTSRKRNLWDT